MTSLSDLAYAAGIVDGEGCVTICHHYGKYIKPRLRVSMREPQAIDLLETLFEHKAHDKRERWYTIELRGTKCLEALAYLEPFLKIKKPQAQLLLRTDWSSREDSENTRKLIHEMNA